MINSKTVSMKERIARIKTPSERKETQPMKVRTPQAKRYVASLKRNHTPIINKVYKTMLAGKHEVITMQDLEKLIAEYPEVEKLTNKGKESKLNGTLLTLQFYNKGSLEFTVILSEGKLYRFKK